jgi:hypothetical protein
MHPIPVKKIPTPFFDNGVHPTYSDSNNTQIGTKKIRKET